MKTRVSSVSALAVLLACAGCASSAAPEPEASAVEPVVGGGVDTANQFPWVGVLFTPSGGCSAELVAPNWILTANHCVTGTTSNPTPNLQGNYTVSFDPLANFTTTGNPSLTFRHTFNASDPGSLVVARKQTAIDPGSREDNAQDLALIRLDTAVPTGLVPLAPIAGFTAPAGAQSCGWIGQNGGVATLIGYGPTDGSFCPSQVFCSSVPSPGRNSYHDAGWGYQNANTGDQYLSNTWSVLSYHGLAHGDSGGALFMIDKNGLGQVCGINSGLVQNGGYASDYEAEVDSPLNNAFLRANLLNADGSLKGTCNITTTGSLGEGNAHGGMVVQISGNGFDTVHPPAVTFGGVPSPSVTCSSTTQCSATVPAGTAGTVPVSVTMWQNAVCTGNTMTFQYAHTATSSDILWQNTSSTEVGIWQMKNDQIGAYLTPATSVSPTWVVKGTGDFNGDGIPDVLWQDTATNLMHIWQMNSNGSIGTPVDIPNNVAGWVVLGTGDFNGDLTTDILWLNTSTSAVGIWQMHNSQIGAYLAPMNSLPPGVVFQGTGDFNGDGISDVLWRDTLTNQMSIWQMNSSGSIGATVPITNNVAGWVVLGTGDFNGDGITDILWQNTSSSAPGIWQMNKSSQIAAYLTPTPSISSTWRFRGTGYFNGDGIADVLWQDTSTNQMLIWQMNLGGQLQTTIPISNNVSGWAVQGVLNNGKI